ncbi:hypothetical protein E4T38_04104 [Aureobasidium subglaciale]|nr:hypothetical protein E4T38_04104 [Aureobasidium subglaciale]KAI5224860.1 hypothetical protein E4T40_03879 [Aureobasidium subglaciale]KAI5227925.1 hypothetical protein E4T41_04099 [Aureobasidium subglaciale]KAI5263526.1 hypothetical protein E4T46_03720 [Aureobasidium subglaciale]
MAKVGLLSAWESAPDILRTEDLQQHRHVRPHSESTPRPDSGANHHGRRYCQQSEVRMYKDDPSRRRADQVRTHLRGALRTPQHLLNTDGAQDPPYPVTPPPQRLDTVPPQIGYRAPTPLPTLPASNVPPSIQKLDNKPPRLLRTQRRCVHNLDGSLPALSISALASGSILLVSAILFVRSVMVGTPHGIVGRSALVVFFALSVAAFIVSFGLILGVLCRRARATKTAAVRAQVRQEIELGETRSRASEGGLPMYDMRRRNAICERRDEPEVDAGGIINRPNAPPVRVASRHLSRVPFSRPATPHPKPPLSPLMPPVPSTPPPPIPNRNPARLFTAVKAVHGHTNADALSMTVQPSPESGVSPRTVPVKSTPQIDHNGTVSGRSTQMFNQHMLTAGTRELQAYLDASPTSSLNTLAAYRHSDNGSTSTQAIMSDDRSVYSDDHGPIDDDESYVGEASVLSMRKVGKARECYIPAAKSNMSATKSPKAKKKRRSNLKVFTEIANLEGEKGKPQKHQRVLSPLPSAPMLLSEQRNKSSQLSPVRRRHSLSPKKLSSVVKPKAVGLGIRMGRDKGKENVDPGRAEVETWSALGDV